MEWCGGEGLVKLWVVEKKWGWSGSGGKNSAELQRRRCLCLFKVSYCDYTGCNGFCYWLELFSSWWVNLNLYSSTVNRLGWVFLAKAALVSVSELAFTCIRAMVASYSQWRNWLLGIHIICYFKPTKNIHINTIARMSFRTEQLHSRGIFNVNPFQSFSELGKKKKKKSPKRNAIGRNKLREKNSIRDVHYDGTDGVNDRNW